MMQTANSKRLYTRSMKREITLSGKNAKQSNYHLPPSGCNSFYTFCIYLSRHHNEAERTIKEEAKNCPYHPCRCCPFTNKSCSINGPLVRIPSPKVHLIQSQVLTAFSPYQSFTSKSVHMNRFSCIPVMCYFL